MNYQDTTQWMFKQLPMYQNKGKSAYKEDLSNTLNLANHLGNPEQKFKTIHVAGTNGKGSTSHMLASVLQEAGYKVGLYTSPHLKDFRERIRINGNVISKQAVIGFVRRNRSFFEKEHLSFFEMTVGLAFEYFAKKKVDIAVIEVGLGGRLDSTNIITPEFSIITNIGFDHMQFLGNTLEKIAAEKAGVIKESVPVVIGQTQAETKSVLIEKAKSYSSQIYFADQLVHTHLKSDLKGSYQKHNIKTVMQSVDILKDLGYNISDRHLSKGLLKVSANTHLKGRWQVLGLEPKIVCDTAHNAEGLSMVTHQLNNEKFKKLHIVFGVVNDKDLSSIIPLLPKHAMYYFCKPNVQRGLDERLLHSKFTEYGFKGHPFKSAKKALEAAQNRADKNDFIYVGGSTFVVAEII